MKNYEIKLLLLFAILRVSLTFEPGLGYYKAAVFEIKQTNGPEYSGSEIIKKNLNKYNIAANLAGKHNADIIVFAEEGLYPENETNGTWFLSFAENVPDPREERVNPCLEHLEFRHSPTLRNFSCLATKHHFYVVADLIDVKECVVKPKCDEYEIDYCRTDGNDCPKDGKFHFNTLVAFDRMGRLIVRYHKKHLFFEPEVDLPRDFENLNFKTEFGIFAVEICFDLLFGDVVKGADRPEVTGLAFPTWWFDHTPFVYLATPFQQAWAMTNNINVLAANVHYPPEGTLGSGIYSAAKGALIYSHNPDGLSKLLISKVPTSTDNVPQDMNSFDQEFYYIYDDESFRKWKGKEPRAFKTECGDNVLGNVSKEITDYRCHQTDLSNYHFLKLENKEDEMEICEHDFCCSLKYTADSMDEAFYFGVSGGPLNFYDTYKFGVQACILARCEPVNGKKCENFLLKSNTIFRSVDIEGNFKTKYIYPVVINSDVRLTDTDEWSFNKKSRIEYKNSKGNPLLFLSLYERRYDKDQKLKDRLEK